ncbi:MAG: glycosyltransferase [Desulfobulbaceae bacterium]|nr:glycosyltransferase [Desulfobulbaceae bacterium]
MRIAIFIHRIGSYHLARLNALSKICDLYVVEYSAVDNTYQWDIIEEKNNLNLITLFTDSDIHNKSKYVIEKALKNALLQIAPDVVALPGWYGFHVLVSLSLSSLYGIPAVVMSDSTNHDHPRVWWKEWIKKNILHFYSSALVGGTPHKLYMLKLGMTEKSIFTGYDTVDNEYFTVGAHSARSRVSTLRKEYRLPVNYFLSSNRFIPQKNLFFLIEAYGRYRQLAGNGAWKLVILGDGELRKKLENLVNTLNLSADVLFPGFIQYKNLPNYYGLAKAYVQASTNETWGLVINEAMASGLPVLVSDRCGCATDLVHDGINGYKFDPSDRDALVSHLFAMSTGKYDTKTLGKASEEIIKNWSTELFADSLLKAAAVAINAPKKRVHILPRCVLSLLLRV